MDLSAAIAVGIRPGPDEEDPGGFPGRPVASRRGCGRNWRARRSSPATRRDVDWSNALIRLYEGSNNRFINYYGTPRTITTIPYHEALQIRDGAVGTGRST